MMTNEYIKRTDARNLLKMALDDDWEIDYANDRFDEILASDVVEVVRCSECKFWNRERISVEGLARCNTGEMGVRYRTKNDFCSHGMRMYGDDE